MKVRQTNMKSRTSSLRLILAGSVAALLAAPSAHAATYYWDSNGNTVGAGATPNGIWGVDSYWNTTAAGDVTTPTAATTTAFDDLFFSAGTDAINAYSVDLNAGTRNARLVTFEDGTATLSNGTLSLGNGGGITVTTGTVTGATISSNLTISGGQTFNVAGSRTLTLDTGTFTRNAGATLNVLSTGTVTTTMAGLSSGSLVNGIIGPWASHGSGTSTKYATIDGSNNIVGLTGTAAATAANVTSVAGTFNYDVAAVGTLGAGANINTLRYTGATGTIAGALTTNGIMNTGGTALTFSGAITSGTGEMVIHNANTAGTITFNGAVNNNGNMLTVDGGTNHPILTGTVIFGTTATLTGAGGLTKNGSGMLNVRAMTTVPSYSGPTVINGGVLLYAGGNNIGTGTGNITLNGGVLMTYFGGNFTRAQGSTTSQIQILGGASGFASQGNSGSTFNIGATAQWGSATFNPEVFVLQATGTNANGQLTFSSGIDLNGGSRTISVSGIDLTGTANASGVISNSTGTGSLIKIGSGPLTLSNAGNSYNGSTTITQGTLIANSTGALGNSSATNTLIFNGGTLRAGGAITSVAARGVTMTATGIIDTNTFAISIAGNIGGAGGLTKNGTGTLTLSGTNSFGGVTTVNVGTLAITKEVALASNTAANLNVKSGATLALNVDSAGAAGFDATDLSTLLGNISVANTAAQGLQGGATLGLDTSTATGATYTPTSAITDSTGAFGGVVGLTKLGAGTLILNQANTYTGFTIITAGTLQLGSGTATGSLSSSSVINIGTGTTFTVNQTDTVTQGADFGYLGGLGSFTQAGAGTTILNKVNDFSGTTTVSAGVLQLDNALALRNSALVTTGAGDVTLLDPCITNLTLGGLSGATGNVADVITTGYSGVTNLTLNPASGITRTYGGVIANGATGMSLTKTGAGTQVLHGTNTYDGATIIQAGVLQLDFSLAGAPTSNIIDSDSVLSLGGGQLTVTGKASTTTSQTFASTSVTGGANTVANNANVTANPQLVALGAITRSVGGTVNFSLPTGTVGATNGITTSNTNTNGIIGGWATVGATGASPTWAVNNGSNNIIGLATGSYTTTATAGTTAANYTNNNIDVTSSAGAIGGVITPNSLRFNTVGAFTVTLAAGDNIIGSGGILVGTTVGNNLSTITGGNLAGSSGGDLIVHQNNTSNSLTIASLIKDATTATALTKSGAGNLILTNSSNSYSGGTFLNAGTLTYTNDGQLGQAGTRNITFGGAATLAGFNGSSLGTLTVNSGANASISNNSITFTSTTGSGDITFNGGNNSVNVLNLGNASAFTGNLQNNIGGHGSNAPGKNIQFSALGDAVGSRMRFGGSDGDSQQAARYVFSGGTGALIMDNRQVELLAPPSSNGFARALLQNDNSSAANKWVINTNLINTTNRAHFFELRGTNIGDNEFAGTIINSTNGGHALSLNKVDAGRWILSGANTYTGATNISGGTLQVTSLANGGSASSIGASSNAAGNLLLANGTTLRYTGSGHSTNRGFTLNVGTAGHGAILNASGTGAVEFTNTASPAYGTVDQTRTLTLTGTNTGNNTLAANLANNGTGAVSLTKTGTGTWVLSGANVNTGGANISGGGTLVLDYGPNNNSKLAGVLTLNNGGGNITLRGGSHVEAVTSTSMTTGGGHSHFSREVGSTATLSLGAISRSQSVGFTASFAEDNLATTTTANFTGRGMLGGGITVGSNWAKNDGSNNIVGLVSGDYTALPTGATTGTVNYQLSGSQTHTGSASMNSLRIVGTGVTDQTLDLGANQLQLGTVTGAGTIGNSGGLLYAGGGTDNYTITGTNGIQAQNGNQELIIHTHTGNLTLDVAVTTGTVGGGAGLSKSGVGTLILTKASAYTSATFVNQGALQLRNATAAGTVAGGIVVANNAALELANGITVGAEALTITGNGSGSNTGALRNVASNTSTYQGPVTIGNGGARINSDSSGVLTLSGGVVTSLFNDVTFGGAGNTTVSTAAISGAGGLVKDGAGTTTLSAASNTYTGETTVGGGTLNVTGSLSGTTAVNLNSGTLLLGASNIIRDAASVNFNGGTLEKGGGFSEGAATTVGLGALTLSSSSTLDFGTGGVGTLTFASGAFSGGVLSILNWTGVDNTAGTDGVQDRLIFAGDSTVRCEFEKAFSQSSISFNGTAGYSALQFNANYFEVVAAVPEPATTGLIGAVALCALIGYRERRRITGFRSRLSSK